MIRKLTFANRLRINFAKIAIFAIRRKMALFATRAKIARFAFGPKMAVFAIRRKIARFAFR